MERKACTFFGHADAPEWVERQLKEAICRLIEEEGVTRFYVGTHGLFDSMAARVVEKLHSCFPSVSLVIVLPGISYRKAWEDKDWQDCIVPEGIEMVPPRFAIDFRNRWMIDRSTHVITFVTRSWGGAAKFEKMAERKGKKLIKLAH